eukprot:CAMPEP_0172693540 /NCGR_PEP_ID=MMETSP1074-20121228/26067_1 /TAXON_ID=2916 /ORGANISM="Ceratium fusus, Strain PA161109" /LENGTH=161 /DNA_ID=CAMNT_0013513923 /DNA_START=42 /DNA_END=527 /DNA_ORIENTATION=-
MWQAPDRLQKLQRSTSRQQPVQLSTAAAAVSVSAAGGNVSGTNTASRSAVNPPQMPPHEVTQVPSDNREITMLAAATRGSAPPMPPTTMQPGRPAGSWTLPSMQSGTSARTAGSSGKNLPPGTSHQTLLPKPVHKAPVPPPPPKFRQEAAFPGSRSHLSEQ